MDFLNQIGFSLTKALFEILPSSLKWRSARKLRAIARKFSNNLPDKIITLKDLNFDCRKENNNLKIKVQMNEMIGSHIAFEGNYEPGLAKLLKDELNPGEHFLDVGTNIGYFSLVGASCVQKEGRVSSIEASKETFLKLQENIKLNGLEDIIKAQNIAAWSENKVLTFNVAASGHSGMSSVRSLNGKIKKIKVNAKKLEEVIDFKKHPVKVIKLDIEGAELEALKGMKKLILHSNPSIFMELSPNYLKELGSSKEEIIEFLKKGLGYKIFQYDSSGKITKISESDIKDKQLNILAKK